MFARKILRLVGSITAQQIDDEVRIMSELCKGECPFIVRVLAHDWLEYQSLYFIDMEYCSKSLHDYIRENSAKSGPKKADERFIEPKARANMHQKIEPQFLPSHAFLNSLSMETESIQFDTSKDAWTKRGGSENPETETVQIDSQIDPDGAQMCSNITWEPIGTIIYNIVSGLKYIHDKKVVHRDLKPHNGRAHWSLLLTMYLVLYSEKDGLWKLADFGSAAYAASKSLITTHERRGTESYRAPEVIQSGHYNNKSDIFALGCIVFEVIAGTALFKSDWAINLYAQKNESIFPEHWPTSSPGSILYRLGELSAQILSSTATERPGAVAVLETLENIKNGVDSIHDSRMDEDIFPPMDATTDSSGMALRNPGVQTYHTRQLDPVEWPAETGGNEHRPDITVKGDDRKTALHEAVANGNLEMVQWLVAERQADVYVPDQEGQMLLSCAAENGCLEAVEFLVNEGGADVASKDFWQRTPLSFAAENGPSGRHRVFGRAGRRRRRVEG